MRNFLQNLKQVLIQSGHSLDPILSRFSLVSLILMTVGVGQAWGGQAHVYVYSSPTAGGYVDVQTSNSAPSSYTLTNDHEQIGGAMSFGNKTFYLYYQAKPGYHFVNWYKTNETNYNNKTTLANSSDLTSQGQSVKQSATGIGAQNSYYAAVFKGNSYTISFAGNGKTSGTMSDQTGFVYGTAKTLNANAFGRAYTVTYDANGGTCGTSSATATYSFNGWKSSNNTSYGNKASISTFNPAPTTNGATVTLTAQWTSASVTLPSATKTGAVLEGWYVGSIAEGNKITTATYTPTANVTLVANWINKYDFEIGGDNYTINNEAWNITEAFNFVHADEEHMTTTIQYPDVISYNRAENKITALKVGTSKITFTQNTSTTVNNGTIEYTITVDSVANNLAVSATSFTKYVDQEVVSVRSNQNSNGTITTTSSNPNLAHYDISNNKIVIPNSDAQNLPFDNVIITISQAPNAKYKAKKHTITLTVQKYENTLTCSWGSWSNSINFEEEIGLSSNNAAAPLIVTRTSGDADVTTYDAENKKIVANFRVGTATWSVSQAEDYKYQAASAQTLTVNVGTIASPGCMLLENQSNTEHGMYGNTYHEHKWNQEHAAGVVRFEISKNPLGIDQGYKVQQYLDSDGDGNWSWEDVTDYKNDHSTSWGDWKSETLNEDAKGIRFMVKGSVDNYVRNVSVTRKKYVDARNTSHVSISSLNMPSRTRSGAATTATFYVDYSTCDNRIKLASNNPHITFANGSTSYQFDAENSGRKAITLNYTSTEAEIISATITIYTQYEHETLTVNAETLGKLSTTLEYIGSDSYSVNADNVAATSLFQVRDQNGDLVASPAITLSSSNTSAINTVSENRAIDFLCGADDVRITASYAGDATYAAASNSGTFYHDIDVIKLADAITWTIGSDADSKIHVWADSDVPNTIASSDYTSIATYSSNNSDRLSISGSAGSYSLHAGQKGEVTLTATSAGDCTYNVAEESKTIVVDPCRHDIVWNQSFKSLMTEEDGTIDQTIDLTAYAVDSNGVATNKSITYTLASTAFASIVDGTKLHITGAGETTITASTADDNKYDRASASLQVRVRRYGEGCDSEITDVTGADSMHKLSGYTNKKGFTYNIAPSDSILVKIGRESRITCGKIYIHGYSKADAKGTETQIRAYDPSELTNDGTDYIIPIDTSYRSIKFQAIGTTGADPGPSGGTQYKWFKNLHIKQASYLLSNRANITNDRVHVYDAINETVVISYSDKPLLNYRITGNKLTLTPSETVNNDCADYGSYTFTVSGTYTTTGVFKDTIYITTTALDTLCIPIKFTVSAGTELYFQTSSGAWDSETKWSNESGVIQDQVPAHDNPVVIKEAVTISTQVEAYKVKIEEGGSVTIAPNGGLSVGAGGISGATTSNFILQAGTEGVTKGKTGYLRISPEYLGSMPYVKVQMYSIGYYDKSSSEENIAAWQYVGTPMDFAGALAKTVFTRSWIYSYLESTDGWVNNRKTLVMQPFVGYGTTQYDSEDGKMIEYPGKLIPNRGLVTIDLEYTDAEHGHNLLANSFAAPIDIMQLRDTDFVNAERAIYIFNTGSKSQASGYSKGGSGDAAGQYRTIAIGTASEMATRFAKDASLPTTIAPMQGFCVNAQAAGAKFKLNYNKLVWNADYSSHAPTALRAPKRNADAVEEEEMPITGSMKMTLEANGYADNIYLLESERYMTDFEDGYDAHKMESGTLNIFTVENEDKLAIDATNSIIGTRVGVRTGEETAYTITFSYVDGEQEWALYDAETDEMIDITNDNTYTFFAEPNSNITERFMIVESNGAQIPAVTTGNDKVTSDVRAHKFIKDGELFILKNGVLYDVTGARVK